MKFINSLMYLSFISLVFSGDVFSAERIDKRLSCQIKYQVVNDTKFKEKIQITPLDSKVQGPNLYSLSTSRVPEGLYATGNLWGFVNGLTLHRVSSANVNGGEQWFSAPNMGIGLILVQTVPQSDKKSLDIYVYYLRSRFDKNVDIIYFGNCL